MFKTKDSQGKEKIITFSNNATKENSREYHRIFDILQEAKM